MGSMLIHIGFGDDKESNKVKVSLKLPGFLADELRQSSSSGRSFGRSFEFDWASECTEVDSGWMYQGVGACDMRVQDFLHLVRGTVYPAKDDEQLQLRSQSHVQRIKLGLFLRLEDVVKFIMHFE